MNQNPYQSPQEVGAQVDSEATRRFRLLGMTVIEWMVVVGLVLVFGALLLPEVKQSPRRPPYLPSSPSTGTP